MSSVEAKRIRANLDTFRLRYNSLDDQAGWIKFIDETNRKIYFKQESDLNIITQY